jgi:putative hydrolase of the HAD superfamily
MDIQVDKHTAIVFDLDDTLYNEIEYLKSAYVHIAQHLEPGNWEHLYVLMFSLFRSKQDVFEMLAAKYGTDKTDLIGMYRGHDPVIRPLEGVPGVLKDIRAKKGKVGIITDGRRNTQMNKINALGIANLIDKIVISEDIGSEKPNEKNYTLLQEAFNVNVYYYIADNLKKDFIAPRKLGWKTIGIADNGLHIHHENYRYLDDDHKPGQFIRSFAELNIK